MIKNLAWVTTRAAHGRDEDEPELVDALESAGCKVDIVDWTTEISTGLILIVSCLDQRGTTPNDSPNS